MLALVWAQGSNGVIGRDGDLPWRLPEDLARFRALTSGHPVVMGRATWDSLPDAFRPLPGRDNIVLTRDLAWSAPGASVAHDLDDVRRLLGARDGWVVGGAQVYAQTIGAADRLEVTEVDLAPDGDTHAPDVGDGWERAEVDPADGWHTSSTGTRYRFVGYRRAT